MNTPTINSIYLKVKNLEYYLKSILEASNTLYNNNETILLQGTSTVTISNIHSYSVLIKTGNVNITENGVTFNIGAGYTIAETASTIFTHNVVIVGNSPDAYVIIKTIK